MVIKSFTETALVNTADAPLLMVKSLMATDVPVMEPVAPVLRLRSKDAPVTAPSVMSPVVVTALVLSETLAPKVTALKIIGSSEVETLTKRMLGLATVNALLKLDATPEKVTPVPPAVNVVVSVITPPLVMPSTIMVPKPAAVMLSDPEVIALTSPISK